MQTYMKITDGDRGIDWIDDAWKTYCGDNDIDPLDDSTKVHWLAGCMSGYSAGFDCGVKRAEGE